MDFDASKQALLNVYIHQLQELALVVTTLLPYAQGHEAPLSTDSPVFVEANRLVNQVTALKELTREKTS